MKAWGFYTRVIKHYEVLLFLNRTSLHYAVSFIVEKALGLTINEGKIFDCAVALTAAKVVVSELFRVETDGSNVNFLCAVWCGQLWNALSRRGWSALSRQTKAKMAAKDHCWCALFRAPFKVPAFILKFWPQSRWIGRKQYKEVDVNMNYLIELIQLNFSLKIRITAGTSVTWLQ